MNLVLLEEDELGAAGKVRLTGRRREHVLAVHRAAVGDALTVGLLGGKIGRGTITSLDPLEMEIALIDDPPPPLDVTLVLALPRPKVLNRVIAGATSLGVKRIYLINAWRVEKSYWKSPRLSEENLREQRILGLEQARDTILPSLELRRLFRPFVEEELASIARGTRAVVAHPYAASVLPSVLSGPMTLAIGPEGGFIAKEIESLQAIGFEAMTLGPRILRVETAVTAILGRM
ncbi:MAG: 16S rRNA (uracil(1498)-N(3))-methyltransferase [Thermoanaerobaculia bacterium]|nr:16S rRNA (uracil(1498)-N(3))-methyltransferase [Thermoanaerobaculia bacterium]